MRHRALLVLLLLAPIAAHAAAMELFTASTAGTITVGPDGRVVDVALEGRDTLGRAAIEGYETHLRTWRFEPVLQNGEPVVAKAHLRLSLVAAREKGSEGASYGVRDVWFLDPPAPGSDKPTGASSGFKPPVYPLRPMQAGIGGEVLLRLELGADGRVERAGAERVSLLGPVAGTRTDKMANVLAKAAAAAAAGWRVHGYEAGQHVRVPVRFSMARQGWERLHPLDWQPAPWIVAAASRSDGITDLAAGGQAPAKLVLLSKLPSVPGLDPG